MVKNSSIVIQIILNIFPQILFLLKLNKSQILCQDFFCKMLLKKILQPKKVIKALPAIQAHTILYFTYRIANADGKITEEELIVIRKISELILPGKIGNKLIIFLLRLLESYLMNRNFDYNIEIVLSFILLLKFHLFLIPFCKSNLFHFV